MSHVVAGDGAAFASRPEWSRRARSAPGLSPFGQYAVSALMVVAATVLGFVVDNVISAPNLTLIFVLPVVLAGVAFGWGPSLAAVVLGVMAFDFFFTQPYRSFRIASPSDIWAAGLLLAVAAIVTTVATQSRRRALEAVLAAERAEALQRLAQVVIAARPRPEVLQAAAEALHLVFRAPVVIFLRDAGGLHPAATAGGPQIAPADEAAAACALTDRLHVRAETYPFDESEFEFWPVVAPRNCSCVIGVAFRSAEVERPERPERYVDVVSAYLAVALESRIRRDATIH